MTSFCSAITGKKGQEYLDQRACTSHRVERKEKSGGEDGS